MHPTTILPFIGTELRTSALFIQLGVLFTVVAGPFLAAWLEPLDRRRVRWALAIMLVVALAGGRLHFLLNNNLLFVTDPIAALKLWAGPFHVGGGIIGLLLAAPLVTRAFGMKLGQFADGITPSIGLGLAIVRVGCFMQGCCFGDVCHYAWCIAYPPGSNVFATHHQIGLVAADATHSLPVHPLHLYFLAAGLVVAAVSLTAHRYKRYDGQAALLGLLVFTVALAVLEFWRTDQGDVRVYWGPLPQLEWTALALVAVVVTILAVAELTHVRRHRRDVPAIVADFSAVRG